MTSKGVPPEEDIALPTLAGPKHHDYAPQTPDHTVNDAAVDAAARADSDSSDGSATDSADDFNWDEEDENSTQKEREATASKAKRFRFLWMAFMKLSRPIRVLLVGILGCGILITPLLVFQFRFHDNVARLQVHVWSLWLAIVWATSCVTYLAVDLIPKLFIALVTLLGYKVERLRIQIEVRFCSATDMAAVFANEIIFLQLIFAISGWLKLVLGVSWAWIALSVIRSVYQPSGSYWIIINRVMQVRDVVNFYLTKDFQLISHLRRLSSQQPSSFLSRKFSSTWSPSTSTKRPSHNAWRRTDLVSKLSTASRTPSLLRPPNAIHTATTITNRRATREVTAVRSAPSTSLVEKSPGTARRTDTHIMHRRAPPQSERRKPRTAFLF